METRQTSRLLNVTQVAERLGVSTHTVRKWLELRKIPFVKIGACVRFDPDLIEKFIDARRVPAS